MCDEVWVTIVEPTDEEHAERLFELWKAKHQEQNIVIDNYTIMRDVIRTPDGDRIRYRQRRQ